MLERSDFDRFVSLVYRRLTHMIYNDHRNSSLLFHQLQPTFFFNCLED